MRDLRTLSTEDNRLCNKRACISAKWVFAVFLRIGCFTNTYNKPPTEAANDYVNRARLAGLHAVQQTHDNATQRASPTVISLCGKAGYRVAASKTAYTRATPLYKMEERDCWSANCVVICKTNALQIELAERETRVSSFEKNYKRQNIVLSFNKILQSCAFNTTGQNV